MEKVTILGKSTRSVADLNKWLKSKGCPEYAQLYIDSGKEFGVRGDMALFQSCLETGWFWNNEGPFDVDKSQNNFAGLGATGNGVPGDSFPDARTGIRAQCQDLALRCDTYLPKESIISPYAKKQYDTISNRHSKYWEDLSGTWAADKRYHEQIYRIAGSFDLSYPNSKPEETPVKEATWLNIANDKSCVQAMNGGDLIETFEGNSLKALMSAVARHPKMGTWAIGERKKGDVTDPVKDDPNVDYLPFAKIASKKMKEVENGYPEYFVIHWTAGEPSQSGEDGISSGVANGYTYAFLPRDGQLWQGAPIHDGGYHAGNAKISSLKAFGIEVACAGRLEKIGDLFVPWFAKNKDGSINRGRCISVSQVRYDNDGPADDGSFEGYYQVYTAEQVKTLTAIALWFVQVRKMPIDNIVGHDEVATPHGRKCDPGFSILEGGMVAFRALIKKLNAEGKTWRDFT